MRFGKDTDLNICLIEFMRFQSGETGIMESGIDGVTLYSGQDRFSGIQVADTTAQLFVNGKRYKGAPMILKSDVGHGIGINFDRFFTKPFRDGLPGQLHQCLPLMRFQRLRGINTVLHG